MIQGVSFLGCWQNYRGLTVVFLRSTLILVFKSQLWRDRARKNRWGNWKCLTWPVIPYRDQVSPACVARRCPWELLLVCCSCFFYLDETISRLVNFGHHNPLCGCLLNLPFRSFTHSVWIIFCVQFVCLMTAQICQEVSDHSGVSICQVFRSLYWTLRTQCRQIRIWLNMAGQLNALVISSLSRCPSEGC